MLQSDFDVLDELLASDLIFTNHLGQLMSKQDDLDAHKSGMLKITEITLCEQKINIYGDVAVVSIQTYISGSFCWQQIGEQFSFYTCLE